MRVRSSEKHVVDVKFFEGAVEVEGCEGFRVARVEVLGIEGSAFYHSFWGYCNVFYDDTTV